MRLAHLHLARFLILMAPADDGGAGGGGGGGAAELVEVDLPDVGKVKLPKEQAAKAIQARDAAKARMRELETELGKNRATAEEAERKRAKAEEDRAALELAKKGEMDQLRDLLTKDNREKVDRLAAKYRDSHLRAAVASVPELLQLKDEKAQAKLVDDVIAQLRSSCQYDLDKDTLHVLGPDGRPALGADGKPLGVDAYLRQFIAERPYLQRSPASPGSGAGGSGRPIDDKTPTITVAEYDKAQSDPGRAQSIAREIAAKKLRVVQG